MKKEKAKHIAKRITAFAAAAAMAATFTFPTGTELLGINFGMSVVASAETTTDGNFDYTVNENTVTITKYNGYGGDVEIPATIDSKTVTSIGAEAFKDCTSLRSITIPGSVTSIGGYAFHSCTSLESVNIPDSVTEIDAYSFTNCTRLSVITIPKSVTSIASSAFTACSGLSSINVAEENTKYISDDGVLFNNNKTELLFYPANKDSTSYAIPDGVTTIESYAFYENNNLVSITIPDGVTNIGASAFDSCKKLTSVSIPASVNNIGPEAFNSCESLTAISIHENNSEYSSENGVLFDKNKTILFVYPAEKSEKSYTVPNTVKHIFKNSFAGCVNLENITLNEGVENIDLAAFMGCTNLKSINIPSSVTAIGDRAFMSCTSLTEISVHADNSNYSSVDNVLFDKNKTTLIVYPGGKSDTSYSVPSSVTSVYNMAFRMCPNLESIAFPPSVTSFGYSVIIGCEKLASVFVPERAAFTNQIYPAKMFTSEVRYAVSDDKANITGIELGTGQTTVDIPETICGYTVASVLPNQWAKVGKHTHKWDENDNCALCGVDRSSRFDITIKGPSAGKALATQASVICNTTKENCDIIWEPAPTDGIAAYGTAYTASVTISSGSTPVVKINGEAVDSSNITANVDGTFTVKHTFDATEKSTLTASDFSFAAPSDLVYNGSAKEAAFTTAVSGAGDITVKYYDDNGTKLDSAPVNAGTYTVKIDVTAGTNNVAVTDLTADTWTFTITRAAVTVTAPTATAITYGQALSASTLSDTNWSWVDGTVIPDVQNNGYPAKITVDDSNYDYTDVEGYDSTNHTVTRTIDVTVSQAAPTVTEPAATAITYGQALSASTLSDTNWSWVDGTVIPDVQNNGYPAKITVDDSNYDYTDVEGYDSSTHTVTRTIAVSVNKATPTITVTATPTSDIAGKTITVSAIAVNPNNSTLTDVPAPTLTYKVGDSGTETTFTGSFVIPEGTADGTIITITATTAGNGSYDAGASTATVIVTDCLHIDKTAAWEKDSTGHWHICNYCGAEVDKAAHSEDSGTVTTEPTETTEGEKTFKCTGCGYVIRTETIPVTEPSIPDSPEEKVNSFVERLYENVLGRPSDPSKETHIDNLNEGKTATKVAYDFVFSPEFTELDISNEERVTIMYNTFLDRDPDPAGLETWTKALDNGCSIGRIFYGFTQSGEFGEICEEYGIEQGTWEYVENRDKSEELTSFVSRLYTKAMGRDYDVNGLNDHTGNYLENHDLYQMAYDFIFSPEFMEKNLSDEEFVDTMYRTFFDREADPAGKADWLDRMANQGYTREDVLAGFVGSQECVNLVARFGI